MKEAVITVYHDLRRAKQGVEYPVKLRVYFHYKTRLYALGITLTPEKFERSFLAQKPKGELSKIKDKIVFYLARAKKVASELESFSFEKFEGGFFQETATIADVFQQYDIVVNTLYSEDRVKTASNYELSKKSLQNYLISIGRPSKNLQYDSITTSFLNGYENWMIKNGRKSTTVGIYLRPLRAIFNTAISDGVIKKESYPFGKKKYTIPAGSNIKKALSKADLKLLSTYQLTDTSPMLKAREFWFFSYQANGMNIRDICELKFSNLQTDKIVFYRTKTKRTTKGNSVPIIVVLTPFLVGIISKYGNSDTSPDNYIFPIFEKRMTAKEKVRKCEIFIRFINQHMKTLAIKVGVDKNISSYYARHSNATISIQNGVSLEFIQESFGHQSIKTTQSYFAGFDLETKKQHAAKLMDFE
jgi:integrase/recombinase XerD